MHFSNSIFNDRKQRHKMLFTWLQSWRAARRIGPGTYAQLHKAIADYISVFSFTKPAGVPPMEELSVRQASMLMQELGWRALSRGRADAVSAALPDSWFNVALNGVPVLLPRYTLMTMRHCIAANSTGKVDVLLELAHWERMRDQLSPSTLFVDIGAATGAMTVPFSLSRPSVNIIAFEPSRTARSILEETIAKNNAQGITILPYALSDDVGSLSFIEAPEDMTGNIPYLPETSRLMDITDRELLEGYQSYEVEVRRLDDVLRDEVSARYEGLVIKIDVEGFEDKVLAGGLETIKKYRPFFSIDIHMHPGKNFSTDAACRSILSPFGYSFERLDHVLIAIPNR